MNLYQFDIKNEFNNGKKKISELLQAFIIFSISMIKYLLSSM